MNKILILKGILVGVIGGLTAGHFGDNPTTLLWWVIFSPFLIVSVIVDVYLGVYDFWLKKPKKKKETSVNIKIPEN